MFEYEIIYFYSIYMNENKHLYHYKSCYQLENIFSLELSMTNNENDSKIISYLLEKSLPFYFTKVLDNKLYKISFTNVNEYDIIQLISEKDEFTDFERKKLNELLIMRSI